MSESVFQRIRERSAKPRFMTLIEYLEGCKASDGFYASAPERLLKAIGQPVLVNTANSPDPRLGRIHQNRKIKVFPAFSDFHGIESAIEDVYNFLKAASQGLEEAKQILYLLGPVGSAKSSLAERLKDLMEREKIYVLAVPKKDSKGGVVAGEYTLSPMYESPLGLFPKSEAEELETLYDIPRRYFDGFCSPWAMKRLEEMGGDVSQFWVAELYPSRLKEVGIAKTEPGDENNQDISSLVGKVDVRMLEEFAINDPDAYNYSGALNKASQGLMEFVEMFKAPIKTLHPLLTATQERNFLGTENIGAMPFRGIILAHSNEAEWGNFKQNPKNEAFLDRVKIIKVKYNLRLTDEQSIYRKLLSNSKLAEIPVAPFSLDLLARVVIASRLKQSTKATKPEFKVRLYDGEDLRNELPNAPTLFDLFREAGQDEGMTGISTRTAFKIISRAANSGEEVGLDPVELLRVLKEEIELTYGEEAKVHATFADDQAKNWLYPKLGDIIRQSLLESYVDFAQTRFERYFEQAQSWLNVNVGVYEDPDTGQMVEKEELDKRLKEVEVPAKIQNGKDFRNEIQAYVLQYKVAHEGRMPRWDDYEPMKRVIQSIVIKHTSDLLPLISFEPKRDAESAKKHKEFVDRMKERGFTEMQIKRIVVWYNNVKASS